MGQIRPNTVNIHGPPATGHLRSPESGPQSPAACHKSELSRPPGCGEKVATWGHGEDRQESIRHRLDRREVLQTSKKGRGTPDGQKMKISQEKVEIAGVLN